MKTLYLAPLGLALALASVGCADKALVMPDAAPTAVTTPSPAGAPVNKAASKGPQGRQYVVRKGDTLWSIAAKNSLLGDPFRWPLIFKANRDQIQDPDTIEVAQALDLRAPTDDDADNAAIKMAKDTPPFTPHSGPRKQLPLNY